MSEDNKIALTDSQEGRRATIHDVAREAGVSTGTVSLALSDNPAVAKATKKRVREIANRLNYSPSAAGRALQSRKANAVGLVVPHSGQHVFGHLYFMEVLSGVSEILNQADMTLVLSTAEYESEQTEEAYLKILHSQRVDGVVLASAALHDANIARLKQSPYPFVFIGRYPLDPALPAVGIDDQGGACLAVQHLLSHGHSRIAHISGPLHHLSALDRFMGYKTSLIGARITPRPEYSFEGDYSEEAGRAGMRHLLNLAEPPTALFAANDETALGAIEVLRESGIEPGKAFPVVGFDDVLLARHACPSLTTVRQPMRQLGSLATRMLLEIIQGHQPDQVQTELATELVVRRSCGCS
ncbi:MAG TPA: LacI family DNA-binding transcriptional regulator [Chloroflexia bacterium]|nr:LacI family DNA-binding transcriptional regulator [Chloroflexia bacterium]